jgi:hypothetical protein
MLFLSRDRFIKSMRFYYRALAREETAFGLKTQKHHLNTMMLIGAGAIPYTALYYRKNFYNLVCIEKNKILAIMAKYLISNKDIKNITIVREDAINCDFPDNALFCISLLTHGKQAILQKAYRSKDSLICLRIPDKKSIYRYEQVNILENDCSSVDVPRLAMKSILISTNNTN